MKQRHVLSDLEWSHLVPLLPAKSGRRGRPWNDHRRTLNGILWILGTGAPWRDLPPEFGPWKSVHDRLNRWSRDGTWKKIQERLLQTLDGLGGIDHDLWFIDGSCIRASKAAAGAAKRGASRSSRITGSVDPAVDTEARSILFATGTVPR
jgi:transposase